MPPIRILLAEDQTLVRDALARLLGMQPHIEVVAAVADGRDAQLALENHAVDLLLTDIEMPNCDGLTLCQWASQHRPEIRTLILTTYNRSGYLKRGVQAGAKGFVLKDVGVDQLVHAIDEVSAGKTFFDMSLVLAGLNEEDPLSERERQILQLSEAGLTTAAIAERMCLSPGTVRNYVSEAISKLYANSRLDAARIARQKGWL